jgi:hypothetical protein
MKILLINDNVEEYDDWLAKLNDWFMDNPVCIKFMSVEDSGHIQPFYNHLYLYFELEDEYLDFFILTWGKYIDHIEP